MATTRAQFTATARSQPTSTPTLAATATKPGPTPTPSNTILVFKSDTLGFALEYPDGWRKQEYEEFVILSPSAEGLNSESFTTFSLWFGRSADHIDLAEIRLLVNLPADLETLRQGEAEIGSLTWQTAQIRFKDITSQNPVMGTLAVVAKDGQYYFMVAVAPETEWNDRRPVFLEILRSFQFVNK